MMIPSVPDLVTAAIRTDYSDDDTWRETWAAVTAPYSDANFDWEGASLIAVESLELSNLTPAQIASLERDGYHSALVVIDERSLRDHTAVVVDVTGASESESFRSIPEQLQGILDNLGVSNMSFDEFAAHVAEDGVFRGFLT